MVEFWLKNPSILLNDASLKEIIPLSYYSFPQKLNAITRLVVLLMFLGFVTTKSVKILISGFITLLILVILYKSRKDGDVKENLANLKELITEEKPIHQPIDPTQYSNPTPQNPLMNMLPTDDPKRKPAAPSYNKHVDKQIKDSVDKRLFADLGDNVAFEHCMRNFHTMPNTTMPNNQKEFAEFCYGDMHSRKEELFN